MFCVAGKPALLSMAGSSPPRLVHHSRPVFCHLMHNNIIVFTGFRKKKVIVSNNCKITTDAHHSPTLVEGNCPLSLLVRLVTTRLYRNPCWSTETIQNI